MCFLQYLPDTSWKQGPYVQCSPRGGGFLSCMHVHVYMAPIGPHFLGFSLYTSLTWWLLAGTPPAPPLFAQTSKNQPVTGNVVSDSTPPMTGAFVASFMVIEPSAFGLPGLPMLVMDPDGKGSVGSLAFGYDGSYVFTPAPGFVGGVPLVEVTLVRPGVTYSGTYVTLSLSVTLPLPINDTTLSGPEGQPITGNVLPAFAPFRSGYPSKVTSFTLPDGTTYQAGSAGVNVTDPRTQVRVGTLVVLANCTAVFSPEPGFTGSVPPIQYTATSSVGRGYLAAADGVLFLSVQPAAREC